ncbi:MAG TPA: trypsin-like peptidase domain-containing protein [Candidatus Sumerlaeota bacterium]|nr:trypsin-like peptidase domain-containing protein [Candidatus Sumerlaeota bacterium]HRS00547.1 trypsin-like peptidase domain-containing protein [Candidatus Sumerlaeia bacterium]HON50756.1 trypsin-like peptidase domain-containing protein [Candidatus Sumerlaeota bacterium]HOR65126.1 trypsin-like peptidase domain-containing protein [Candidatus Sumerlaeota bacterium]HPL75268.1 trypsin-like peptidase domain-containing protein [Candidatus Sumerlaeota bacterium]
MSRKSWIILCLITVSNLFFFVSANFWQERDAGKKGFIANAEAKENTRDASSRRTRIVDVAQKVSPAVVNVGAIRTAYMRQLDPALHDFFNPFILYPYEEKIPFLGSGFILDSAGHVVTNFHVIEGAQKVIVTLTDGREVEADILDADKVVDVAVLKIKDVGNLPYVELGNSDDIMIGESVIALGNPFGNLIEDPHPTVTAGVISAVNRSFNPDMNNMRVYTNMIQTDAAINPGNSGGPLINMNGEVVGVNTFIMSRSGGSHGIGFAIPINRIKSVIKEILEYGQIRPLWRDFECVNLTPHLMRILKTNDRFGSVVRRMEKGGAAEACGLQVGDIIKKANGREVRNSADLMAYFSALQVGDSFELEAFRDGKILKLKYIVKEYK